MTTTQTTPAAQFARTFSATTRHIVNPEKEARTLCGGKVRLTATFIGDDGEIKHAEPWMVMDLEQCERCAKSAAKRGISF